MSPDVQRTSAHQAMAEVMNRMSAVARLTAYQGGTSGNCERGPDFGGPEHEDTGDRPGATEKHPDDAPEYFLTRRAAAAEYGAGTFHCDQILLLLRLEGFKQ